MYKLIGSNFNGLFISNVLFVLRYNRIDHFQFNGIFNTPTSTSIVAPAAKNKVSQSEPTANDDGGICHDLQARLDKLRKM